MHGTNNLDFKLCCFVSVNKHGTTVIFGFCLLMHGGHDDFVWAFEHFTKTFSTPRVLFTDSDGRMASACIYVFGQACVHLLCIFHLWKNFYQHLHCLYQHKGARWREVARIFWRENLRVIQTFTLLP